MKSRAGRRIVGMWRRHPSMQGTPKDGAVTVAYGRRYQYDARRNAWRIVHDWRPGRWYLAAVAAAGAVVVEAVRVVAG